MILYDTPGQAFLIGPLRDGAGNPVTAGASIYLDTDGTATAGAGTLTHWRGGTWRYQPTQAETARMGSLWCQLEAAGAAPTLARIPIIGDTAVHMGTLANVAPNGGTLDPSAPAGVSFTGQEIYLHDGPGKGQSATILKHDQTSGNFIIARPWAITPTTVTKYSLGLDLFENSSLYYGQAMGGSTSYVDFAPDFTLTPDPAGDYYITVRSGAAKASTRLMTGYDPATRRAIVSPPFPAAVAPADWISLYSLGRTRLAADGLADTTPPTLAAGQLATTIPGMVAQTWRDSHYKSVYNRDAGRIDRYNADGTTVLLRQPATDDGTTQTRGIPGPPA